jgi:hypothetical protein
VSSTDKEENDRTIPESIIDNWKSQIDVLCQAVDTTVKNMHLSYKYSSRPGYSHALNDSVHLVTSFCALAFLAVIHDAMLHLSPDSQSHVPIQVKSRTLL